MKIKTVFENGFIFLGAPITFATNALKNGPEVRGGSARLKTLVLIGALQQQCMPMGIVSYQTRFRRSVIFEKSVVLASECDCSLFLARP